MRIRQVKPAFWSDAKLAELPEATRLFYIGLWMEADDAGWFAWDAVEIAHDLYGYESRSRRERRAAAMYAALVDAGRLVEHPCGHVEIPTLAEHQRLAAAAKQVKTVFNEHLKTCISRPKSQAPDDSPQVPAHPRTSPARNGKEREQGRVRNGTERNGNQRASATTTDEEKAALDAAWRRQGLPVPA